jgi:four helix bundle protein
VLAVYAATKAFPRAEQFGLTFQLRRCAVSVASSIVEGCARNSESDYIRFPDFAFASARELEYQLSIAARWDYLPPETAAALAPQADETERVLAGLARSLREKP